MNQLMIGRNNHRPNRVASSALLVLNVFALMVDCVSLIKASGHLDVMLAKFPPAIHKAGIGTT